MKVGIGIEDITPKLGMRTEIFQNTIVDKIVTPLLIKVCIFQKGNERGAIVCADVMDFFYDSIKDIRSIIHDVSGIEQEKIFLNSSHTHSAPYIYPTAQKYLDEFKTGFLDWDYYESLLDAVQSAAEKAVRNQEYVIIKHSRGLVSGVASNRRAVLEDGSIGTRYGRDVPENLRQLEDGIIDPYAECLWFENEHGKLKGMLVNYACHGTAYGQLTEICWDYMGFAREYIEEALGGEALFLQGCAGNMSPGKYTINKPLEDIKILGKRLADDVIKGYSYAEKILAEDLCILSQQVILRGRTTLSAHELKNRLEAEIIKTKEIQKAGSRFPEGAMVISYLERLLMIERYPELDIPFEVGLIRIGDTALIFLPGESFIQYALEIKKFLGSKPCLVMAYSDCTLQYIPNSEAYEDKGGYETDSDWCYSAKGNGETLVEAAKALIRKVYL